jgi:hypothetical protein
MPSQGWAQLLNSGPPWQTTVGTALSTVTRATISPQAPTTKDFAVATSYLYPGAVFRLTAQGFITTTATSSVFTIFVAAGVTPTTLCTPVGITTGTTVITGLQWELRVISRVTAIGSTGNTISSQGYLELGNTGAAVPANPIALTAAATGMKLPMPNISGETAAAIDTTSAMAVMVRGTSTVAGPSMQCTQFLIESLD